MAVVRLSVPVATEPPSVGVLRPLTGQIEAGYATSTTGSPPNPPPIPWDQRTSGATTVAVAISVPITAKDLFIWWSASCFLAIQLTDRTTLVTKRSSELRIFVSYQGPGPGRTGPRRSFHDRYRQKDAASARLGRPGAPPYGSRNRNDWRIIGAMRRDVGAELEVEISAPTTLEFQIAVAPHPNTEVSESLSFVLDGNRFQPLEISGVHGNRIHKLDAPVGNLKVNYAATIVGQTDPAPVTEYDLSMYLRPSRYAEADKFYGFAATEFGNYIDSATLLEKVSSWVGTRLNYVPGSSDPIDGAVDTLLAGAGVCRDFAHLVVALLRAVNVPARVVSVYAPGLYPMDFHAVAEAFVEGQWRVVDGTLLAPRQTLVRIATGRDAADIASLDNHKGQIELNQLVVTAVVEGGLPRDSIDQLVSIR